MNRTEKHGRKEEEILEKLKMWGKTLLFFLVMIPVGILLLLGGAAVRVVCACLEKKEHIRAECEKTAKDKK